MEWAAAGWKQYLLNTVKVEKNKEESTHCPVFLLFFFHLHYGEPTMEVSWEKHAGAQPLGVV